MKCKKIVYIQLLFFTCDYCSSFVVGDSDVDTCRFAVAAEVVAVVGGTDFAVVVAVVADDGVASGFLELPAIRRWSNWGRLASDVS